MNYTTREIGLAALVVALTLTLGGCLLYFWQPQPQRYASETFSITPTGGIAVEGEDPIIQSVYPGITRNVLEGQILFSGIMSDHYVQIHYPQGFNPVADDMIFHWAAGEFGRSAGAHCLFYGEEAKGEGLQHIPSVDHWRYKKNYPLITTYALTETGSGYATVAFRSWGYNGGNREYCRSTALSFHKATGGRVTLERLFPGNSICLVAEWLTAQADEVFDQTTTGQMIDFKFQKRVLSANDIHMDQIVLMPKGIAFVLDPTRLEVFTRDELTLFIPRAEFEALGVNTEFWPAQ